jgi:hypothetical protein
VDDVEVLASNVGFDLGGPTESPTRTARSSERVEDGLLRRFVEGVREEMNLESLADEEAGVTIGPSFSAAAVRVVSADDQSDLHAARSRHR